MRRELNTNLGIYTFLPFNGATAKSGVTTQITDEVTLKAGTYLIVAISHINKVAVYTSLFGNFSFDANSNVGFMLCENSTDFSISLNVIQYSGSDVTYPDNYKSGLHIVRLK